MLLSVSMHLIASDECGRLSIGKIISSLKKRSQGPNKFSLMDQHYTEFSVVIWCFKQKLNILAIYFLKNVIDSYFSLIICIYYVKFQD